MCWPQVWSRTAAAPRSPGLLGSVVHPLFQEAEFKLVLLKGSVLCPKTACSPPHLLL